MVIATRFLYLIEFTTDGSMNRAIVQRQLAQRQLKALGHTIRECRHLQQLSQEELAARANIHVTYLSAFECGKRNPSLAVFFSVASALRVRPADLLQSTTGQSKSTESSERTRKKHKKRRNLLS